MKSQRLSHDQWGRNECFLAQWLDPIGASSQCLFSEMDAAIFFVVTGIGCYIDWETFPDPSREYPYEERDGSRNLSPVFLVERVVNGKPVRGSVLKMTVADNWTVGNGIAVAARQYFAGATGRDIVLLKGQGDKLTAQVRERRR